MHNKVIQLYVCIMHITVDLCANKALMSLSHNPKRKTENKKKKKKKKKTGGKKKKEQFRPTVRVSVTLAGVNDFVRIIQNRLVNR